MTQLPVGYFPATYRAARERFLAAVTRLGGVLEAYENVGYRGASGERLFLDVAAFGAPEADTVLLIGAGTHGVEGHCGSGCQLGGLAAGLFDTPPPGIAVMLVHAFNPWGYSHGRRVNENNVDLNRNFVDFGRARPGNDAYDELHEHLCPADWSGEGRERAEAGITDFIETRGMGAYQAALTGGQYTHPDGLFFGGDAPEWSNTTWQSIIRKRLAGRRRILLIDVHTGLGPYGYGEPIFVDGSGPDGFDRVRAWLGDEVTDLGGGTSVSARVEGPISTPLRWHAPDAEFWAISLEYGTRPLAQAIEVLRAENWLHAHPETGPAESQAIRRRFRDAFYVDEDDWKVRVWSRFESIYRRAVAGLSSG